ncbi:MAG: hypothetical protein ACRDRL_14170, partial [Sciscionella sp.]
MSVVTAAGRVRLATCSVLVVTALWAAACGSGGTGSTAASGPGANFKPGALDKQYSGTTISVLVPSWAALP